MEMDENNGRDEASYHVSKIIDDRSYVSGAPIDPMFRVEWESKKSTLLERIDQIIASRSDR